MHLSSADVQVVLTFYWGQYVRLNDLLSVTIELHKIHPSQLFSCQPSIPDNENTYNNWVNITADGHIYILVILTTMFPWLNHRYYTYQLYIHRYIWNIHMQRVHMMMMSKWYPTSLLEWKARYYNLKWSINSCSSMTEQGSNCSLDCIGSQMDHSKCGPIDPFGIQHNLVSS